MITRVLSCWGNLSARFPKDTGIKWTVAGTIVHDSALHCVLCWRRGWPNTLIPLLGFCHWHFTDEKTGTGEIKHFSLEQPSCEKSELEPSPISWSQSLCLTPSHGVKRLAMERITLAWVSHFCRCEINDADRITWGGERVCFSSQSQVCLLSKMVRNANAFCWGCQNEWGAFYWNKSLKLKPQKTQRCITEGAGPQVSYKMEEQHKFFY